ncbi:uncharacterized protein LOC144462540 [Epinephelus lanceolatus]
MIKICAYSCLLSALSFVEMKSLSITGHVGKSLTIKCSDWDAWTDVKYNVKYICDSPCTEDKHVIIKAAFGETTYKNRTEVTNTAEGLFVTFSNLQESDLKTYYCGVERFGPDLFIEVNLKVTKDTNSNILSSSSSEIMTNMSTSHTTLNTTLTTALATQGAGYVPYLTAGVILIITIVMVVLILAWKKMKKQQVVVSTPQEDAVESSGCHEVYQALSSLTMDDNQVYSTLTCTQRSAGPEEVSQSAHPLTINDQVYRTLTPTQMSAGPVEVSQSLHPLTVDEDPVYSTITPTKMSAVLESKEVDTSNVS